MGLNWCRGTVTRKQIWTEGLFTLHVAVDGVMPFEPGQFLQVGVKSDEQSRIYRPYSVASPHGPSLEFYIVRVDDGALTPRLWNLANGDAIEISERAAGSFTLSHAPRHPDLWLIATGTGLAPYIAMLRSPAVWASFARIIVVHGVRYRRDLSYTGELAEYERTRPGVFTYVPMATRDDCPQGLAGRITTRLVDQGLEERAGCRIAADRSTMLLCGNPAMLDEVESLLIDRGLQKHRKKSPGNIVVERYW